MKSGWSVALVGAAMSACGATHRWTGADTESGTPVVYDAGEMPSGASFAGDYESGALGELRLIARDQSARGTFQGQRAGCVFRGALDGPVRGNLWRFAWREDGTDCMSETGASSGRGFFLYVRPSPSRPDELVGEWGVGDAEHGGGQWIARRRANARR